MAAARGSVKYLRIFHELNRVIANDPSPLQQIIYICVFLSCLRITPPKKHSSYVRQNAYEHVITCVFSLVERV